MLAFTAVVLAALWLFQIVFLDDMYRSVKMANIDIAAEIVSSNISSGNSDLKSLVSEYAVKYDTCISVWDGGLKIVASTCVNNSCRVHTYGLVGAGYFYTKAQQNGGTYMERYGTNKEPKNHDSRNGEIFGGETFEHVDDENESMMYAHIIRAEDGTEYLLLMNAVVTPIASVVQSLKTIFLFIAQIMLALTIIISAFLSRYILKPIDKINAVAKLFAKGDYNVRFDENSYSEVAQLASTLNYAAAELSTVENTRRELIANVSHDLRTPLALISGYAEMMKDFPNDDNRENLQTIIDEVNHMTSLVDDMTDVSKYNAGVHKLNVTEFNLTMLVRDTAVRISRLNDPDGYTVDFEYDSEVFVLGDELKITQVLYNLINNAIIHTGSGKKVKVSQIIRENGKNKFAEIRIEDNGKGISRDNVKSIWDRYYKMDKTYKRAHNGSGLGLSIVKSILELHNMEYGVVPAEDMPDGTGCIFWFRTKITKRENKI